MAVDWKQMHSQQGYLLDYEEKNYLKLTKKMPYAC